MKTKVLLFCLLFMGLNLFWQCTKEEDCGDWSEPTISYRKLSSLNNSFYRVNNGKSYKLTSNDSLNTHFQLDQITFNLSILSQQAFMQLPDLENRSNTPFSAFASSCPPVEIVNINSIEDITVVSLHNINDSIKARDTINSFIYASYLNTEDSIYQNISLDLVNRKGLFNPQNYSFYLDSLFLEPNTTLEFKTYLELSDKTDSSLSPRIYIRN